MVRLRALAMISCFLTKIYLGDSIPQHIKIYDYDALAIKFTISLRINGATRT